MRDILVGLGIIGFSFGIILGSLVAPTFTLLIVLSVCGAGAVVYSVVATQKIPLYIGIGVLALVLGLVRFALVENTIRSQKIFSPSQKVSVLATVTSYPESTDSGVRFIITPETSVSQNNFPRMLVRMRGDSTVEYGDQLQITGSISLPKNFITQTGKEFDYVQYLQKDGVLYILDAIHIEKTGVVTGIFMRTLYRVRALGEATLARYVSGNEGALLGGLLIGDDQLDKEVKQEFVTTGMIHIIALSGYNVTIVAVAIIWLLSLLMPRFVASAVGGVGIVMFVLLSGASETAIRAGIMGVLALVAVIVGRPYGAFRALVIAFFCMVLYNPYSLVYNISFQLSFLATIGIILFPRVVEPYLGWVLPTWLRETIVTTISAQIPVVPFILYKMGTLSLISLVANALILPIVPLAMLTGALILAFAPWASVFATVLAYVTTILLRYILSCTHMLSLIPYAQLTFVTTPLWCIGMLYIAILYWVVRAYRGDLVAYF